MNRKELTPIDVLALLFVLIFVCAWPFLTTEFLQANLDEGKEGYGIVYLLVTFFPILFVAEFFVGYLKRGKEDAHHRD